MLDMIRADLALLGVRMDHFASEKALYGTGRIEAAIVEFLPGWSLAPSAGGSSRRSATCRFSAVRWWHSWCRVRSLGLRTSRPSTRYNVPPWCRVQSLEDPATDGAGPGPPAPT